jgi:hypothetical protein
VQKQWKRRNPVPQEKSIDAADLMQNLEQVLDEIHREGIVYIIKTEEHNWRSDDRFVLGPERICGRVAGLIDVEYGWPVYTPIERIQSVWDMAPGYRRHPFIYRGEVCLAVGIQACEYEMINRELGGSPPTPTDPPFR